MPASRVSLILLLFALGNITGAAILFSWHSWETKPLVIQKETKIIGKSDYLKLNGERTPENIYKRVSPGVVTIRSTFETGGGDSSMQGSGFVIDKEGYVVTNMHVVLLDAFAIEKTFADNIYVNFTDGSIAEASLVGSDPNADLALIKINIEPETVLKPVKIGDSDLVRTGQPVLAIGAPFGESGSGSFGIVSSTNRSIQSLVGTFTINNVIQTDAAINKGNSGGPLLNIDGEVIGINTQIRTQNGGQEGGGNEGIAYAVPSQLLLDLLPRLRQGGVLKYPYLGITSKEITPQLARVLELKSEKGLLIQEVNESSPAARSGIRGATSLENYYGEQVGVGGDIILKVDGQEVLTPQDLSSALATHSPGGTVMLTLIGVDGKERNVKTVLISRN
jgi:S1-C subfamily serine protease